MQTKQSGTIAIYGSRRLQSFLPQLHTLLHGLVERKWKVVLAQKLSSFLNQTGFECPQECTFVASLGELPSLPDLVLSIGGDGTFLNTARWVGSLEIPILGLNAGNLGFLATFGMDDPEKILQAICGHHLHVEERILLHVSGDEIRQDLWTFALNEVALLSTGSMITASTYVDGFFLGDYIADGLIISTPTGSTGYNLSVGGPILQPSLNALVLSPIAPHTLTLRPVVIHAQSEISILLTSRAPKVRIALDGRSFLVSAGSRLLVRQAPFKVKMLCRPSDNFADTLRHKLLWGCR